MPHCFVSFCGSLAFKTRLPSFNYLGSKGRGFLGRGVDGIEQLQEVGLGRGGGLGPLSFLCCLNTLPENSRRPVEAVPSCCPSSGLRSANCITYSLCISPLYCLNRKDSPFPNVSPTPMPLYLAPSCSLGFCIRDLPVVCVSYHQKVASTHMLTVGVDVFDNY